MHHQIRSVKINKKMPHENDHMRANCYEITQKIIPYLKAIPHGCYL